MNCYLLSSIWLQTKGYIKQTWFKLTDNKLGLIRSRREIIIGKAQGKYRVAKYTAEQCIAGWEKRLNSFG